MCKTASIQYSYDDVKISRTNVSQQTFNEQSKISHTADHKLTILVCSMNWNIRDVVVPTKENFMRKESIDSIERFQGNNTLRRPTKMMILLTTGYLQKQENVVPHICRKNLILLNSHPSKIWFRAIQELVGLKTKIIFAEKQFCDCSQRFQRDQTCGLKKSEPDWSQYFIRIFEIRP